VQPTEQQRVPYNRTRAGLYGVLAIVLLTALVLVMLARQALV
jgi:hypothetical protein